MALFRRCPAAVDRLARTHTGERALAAAPLRPARVTHAAYVSARGASEAPEGWAVATRHYVAVVRGEHVLARAWCDVDTASLDAEAADLTVRWVDGTDDTVLALADNQDPTFARTLRERVQSSVVIAESVPLARGVEVRVAVRRDARGELFSQVIGPAAVDLTDPATAAAVDAAEARVRDASGLPR
ncbi:MAG: hypothetical protein ACTMIR_14820 [Cellulomonadaceae bacterium]